MILTVLRQINTQPLALVGYFAAVHPEGSDVRKKADSTMVLLEKSHRLKHEEAALAEGFLFFPQKSVENSNSSRSTYD